MGTETETPVVGNILGEARLPLCVLVELKREAKTFNKKNLVFHLEPGCVQLERFKIFNPGIKLGNGPDSGVDLPVDLSPLDTLACAQIFGSDRIGKSLRERIEKASQARRIAVHDAFALLQTYGVTEQYLQALVDARVREAAMRLRPSLGAA